MSQKLAKLIKEKREEMGISIEEISKELSYMPKFYQKIETGIEELALKKAAILSKKLEIKPYIFFQAALKND